MAENYYRYCDLETVPREALQQAIASEKKVVAEKDVLIAKLLAERDALTDELTRAANMLHSVAGDIEDGHSLDSMRGKYVLAVLSARDRARAVLNRIAAGDSE